MQVLMWIGAFSLLATVAGQDDDGYTDENRPYKFGFNIEGHQHRKEEKDEKGIIRGEYGFITADGYYRVTVYKTDENGDFKIVSMKNYYVGFPPGDPTTTPAPSRSPGLKIQPTYSSGLAPTTKSSTERITTTPSSRPTQVTTSRGQAACSSCFLPPTTTTTRKPSPLISALSPSRTPTLSRPTVPVSNDPFKSAQPGKPAPSDFNKDPPNKGIILKSNIPEKRPLTKYPETQKIIDNDGQSQFKPQDPKSSKNAAGLNQYGNGGLKTNLNQATVITKEQPINNRNSFNNIPGTEKIQTNVYDNTPIEDLPPEIPQNNTPIEDLPPEIPQNNANDLLYRFNYTVGFHGHHEDGYRNGDKVGDYFVNGRDGVSRRVQYVANEFGYQPNITLVDLQENDPKYPREETEKKYGLEGYEFKWFYRK